MKKWFLPLLLVLSMLFSVSAFAADGKLSAVATPSADGKTVQLKLDLTNPGIVATRILVRYDSKVLRLQSAKNGTIFDQSRGMFGQDLTACPYILLWEDSLRTTNITTSGTLCTLSFSVVGKSASGTTTIEIEVDDASTFDVNLTNVNIPDCKVSVKVPTSTATVTPGAPATTTAATTTGTTKAVTTTKTATTTKAVTTTSASVVTSSAVAPTLTASESTAVSVGTESTTGVGTTVPVSNPATDETEEFIVDASLFMAEGGSEPSEDSAYTAFGATDDSPVPKKSFDLRLLWILLILPIAAVVIVIVKKKKS